MRGWLKSWGGGGEGSPCSPPVDETLIVCGGVVDGERQDYVKALPLTRITRASCTKWSKLLTVLCMTVATCMGKATCIYMNYREPQLPMPGMGPQT